MINFETVDGIHYHRINIPKRGDNLYIFWPVICSVKVKACINIIKRKAIEIGINYNISQILSYINNAKITLYSTYYYAHYYIVQFI